jgi:hypothetical protein
VTVQCAFGEGSYRCTREGVGDPPLCREHFLLLEYADDDPEEEEAYEAPPGFDETDFFQGLLDTLLQHRAVQDVFQQVKRALRHPERLSPHYQGPGQAYAAEAPPRPHNNHRPPPQPPPRYEEDPRAILHFGPTDPLTPEIIRKRQRQLARLAHPDQGGSEPAMQRINAAADALISQLR